MIRESCANSSPAMPRIACWIWGAMEHALEAAAISTSGNRLGRSLRVSSAMVCLSRSVIDDAANQSPSVEANNDLFLLSSAVRVWQ